MNNFESQFAPFQILMQAEKLDPIIIDNFKYYYEQLLNGNTGFIPENEIDAVATLPDAEQLPDHLCEIGQQHLSKTAVIKLNGGLGTGMGLAQAKSLLPVKEKLTFLDIIARQALAEKTPLVLMNSFSTQADSLAHLQSYPVFSGKLSPDFLQGKVLKINQHNFTPADWPQNPAMQWCPAGHGDIYISLVISGMLKNMLESGIEYAFVSNSDNLGAVMDVQILGYFIENKLPFMMEVADRTEADKKGGHLAASKNGQLLLRESAQCPPEDIDQFQNTNLHKYFNTNNLWIHLPSVQRIMNERKNILGLPMIRNSKTVDPRDKNSTAVFQLETAMGSAIAVFKNAGALRIPKTRFAPVKTTNDLLAVRSDCYILAENSKVIPNPERELPPIYIDLDSQFYKMIDQFDARFSNGMPSLVNCARLKIKGDFSFGKNITLSGSVVLDNQSGKQVFISDNSIISNHQIFR